MATYAVTGKLGAGKTLGAIYKIREALRKGLPIATNIDLELPHIVGVNKKKTRVYRIKDKPTLYDLQSIGYAYPESEPYNEDKFGWLVFDECGTWFNSRNWNDKDRKALIDELLHIRKKRWHVIFIIQDISLIDKQAKEALVEHVVYMRRSDRVAIPFIGNLFSMFTGIKLSLPKMHYGIVKYGVYQHSLTVDKWVFSGKDLYKCYDTEQVISDSYDSEIFCELPPWHRYGRYRAIRNMRFYMRLSKIYLRQYSQVAIMVVGLLMGIVSTLGSMMPYMDAQLSDYKQELLEASQVNTSDDSELEENPIEVTKNVKIESSDFINDLFTNYKTRFSGFLTSGKTMNGYVEFFNEGQMVDRLTIKQLSRYGWRITEKDSILEVSKKEDRYFVTLGVTSTTVHVVQSYEKDTHFEGNSQRANFSGLAMNSIVDSHQVADNK